MPLRSNHEVPNHLHCLCIDRLDMVLDDHLLHEILMHQLSAGPPLVGVLHQKEVVTTSDDVPNMGRRPVVVDRRLLIE
jgi:hypothetical protein